MIYGDGYVKLTWREKLWVLVIGVIGTAILLFLGWLLHISDPNDQPKATQQTVVQHTNNQQNR